MISVIIPTYNEQQHIEQLLSSLTTAIGLALEVIVVDGGSTDRTVEMVSHFRQVALVHAPKGRALQMNAGAEKSKGEILFFLHADSSLPQHWESEILTALSDDACVAGSFYLKFNRNGFWYRLYSWFSRFKSSIFTYGDQGLFIWADVFNRVGKYPELPILEDYEILRSIKKVGKVTKLNVAITTSARKFIHNGVVLQQLKNLSILCLYRLGVTPKLLAKWYYR
ncbi:MAG: TIGR04283 family arsenosugar biosynthesis glycosyltransferase [Flammeovirgaceae bacterium]